MKCPRCEYEWEPKIPRPKECPRCKGRLDYQPGAVGAPKIKKGGEKEMIRGEKREITRKLPWATAAVIIVVAVIGAWVIFGGAPGEITPTPGGWASYVFAWPPDNSGIENIYFVENKVGCIADPSANMSLTASRENLLEYLGTDVIATRTSPSPNIPYDNRFRLIVSITAKKPPIANLTLDNLYVWFNATGNISFTDNTAAGGSDGVEYVVTGYPTSDTIRVNVVYDNAGAGFKLPAGGSFSYEVRLYIWG